MARRTKADRQAAVIGAAMALLGGAATIAALLIPRRAAAAGGNILGDSTLVLEIDGIRVYRTGRLLWWVDGDMSIDYDGAPNAYAPSGGGKPLDNLANAGKPGNWWGIATDGAGKPLEQGPGEPFPGYYISTTSLAWPGQQRTAHYVDSTAISYLALPKAFLSLGAKLGDIALVESTKTAKRRFAIWADVGPRGKLGEGSAKLASELGVQASSLRKSGINVQLFIGSGDGKPHSEDEIQRRGAQLVQKLA